MFCLRAAEIQHVFFTPAEQDVPTCALLSLLDRDRQSAALFSRSIFEMDNMKFWNLTLCPT